MLRQCERNLWKAQGEHFLLAGWHEERLPSGRRYPKFRVQHQKLLQGIVEFKPLEEKKNAGTAKAEAATAELNEALDKKKKAEDFVADLQAQLKEAQEKLKKVEDECAKLSYKQDLATRLIDRLKDEYVHWKGNVESLGKMMSQVVGINLVCAGFIS